MKVKELLLMGMISVIALTSACGKTETREPVESGKVEVVEKETQKATEAVTEKPIKTEDESLLPGVYEVPGTTICVNVPDMHTIESGFTEIYYQEDVKYVTFTCVRTETAVDAEDALDISMKRFIRNMNGFHDINELTEVTGEMVTVNDIELYAFEGKVNCGYFEVYDAYVTGYSFIFEDKPCAIIGVVMDVAQPQEQIDAVKELVDAMILTVRSEK